MSQDCRVLLIGKLKSHVTALIRELAEGPDKRNRKVVIEVNSVVVQMRGTHGNDGC
jgi:hypothetical protein